MRIKDSCIQLSDAGKLTGNLFLWGISSDTDEIIETVNDLGISGKAGEIKAIVDNFKYTFRREYKGIPVIPAGQLESCGGERPVILTAGNYTETILHQAAAYGIREVYDLRNPERLSRESQVSIPYHFTDRSRQQKALCYILTGYEEELDAYTLPRINAFQAESFDYCLVTSGKYASYVDRIAAENGWSYLWTEQNQVGYIQNLVIELHPEAEYLLKMDEDIFVSRGFFSGMLSGMKKIEDEGEYRINFVVPVIPLNCCGYRSFLNLKGRREDYEERFGRAYRSRFSAVYDLPEAAEYLWDLIEQFDLEAAAFSEHQGYGTLDCYYNIGVILYTRERWKLLGKWPTDMQSSGMGMDERAICANGCEMDMAIYELHNVLAGHLAFGKQKARMMEYLRRYPEKFRIRFCPL